MTANYIEDGYTKKGFIRAVADLHGDLNFEYRPTLVDERDAMYRKASACKKIAESNTIYRNHVANKVVSWDLCDAAGAKLPVKESSLKRMQGALWDRLFFVVIGTHPSDLTDSPTAADTDEYDLMMASVSQDESPGDAALETDAKN